MATHTTVGGQVARRDTTVVKVDSARSPRGADGEKYLASGVRVAMRLWEDEPIGETRATERDYETVGYVVRGRAELHVEGQVVRLEPGDSYVVSRGARHHYRILSPLTAVEATSPPAQVHGRDERPRSSGQGEHESRDRFVLHVAAHAALPGDVTAVAAISAVMCALTERLTAGEAHKLLEAVPRGLRPLFERCVVHRAGPIARKIDRAEFLDRVARHLGVTPAHAELVCSAVFDAVSAELSPKLIDDVAHQLPHGLQELWLSARGLPGPARVVTEETARELLSEIERGVELPAGATVEGAFASVMCALCDRISGGEARDVLLSLPESLRPLLSQCVSRRAEPAVVFDRAELLQKIATHLGTEPSAAESIARVVFRAVRRVLPEKEVRDVASQLPVDLIDLWQSQ